MPRPRLPFALLVVALLGCGPPETPARPATAREAPPAPAAYAVHGTLLGADGAPLPRAEVHLDDRSAIVDARGNYRITAPGPGFYAIYFTAVNHQEEVANVFVDGSDATVDARLGTYQYLPSF